MTSEYYGGSVKRDGSQESMQVNPHLMNKGLSYKFRMTDMSKYFKKLDPKDLKWKFQRSSLGKEILTPKEREVRLFKESYFHKLMKLLRHTDWQKTPVYH